MSNTREIRDHFIIKKDNRDLNYGLYENEGSKKRIKLNDYNSDNTIQLNVKQIVKLLKSISIDLD